MNFKSLVIVLASLSVSIIGCSDKVAFSGIAFEEGLSIPSITVPPIIPDVSDDPVIPPEPEEPVVVVPEPEEPVVPEPGVYNKTQAACSTTGVNVLQCLNCRSEAAQPADPILSRKARELVEIMTAGCSVPNKSDSAGYVAPTRQQIMAQVIQCSSTAYPDTAFIRSQAQTINALLTNPTAQQKAFGALYYNSASTDFETYFGLEIKEARNIFCRGTAGLASNGVYPKEYYDSLYDGSGHYQLPSYYQDAQIIRNDLRSCMTASRLNPHVNVPQPVPGKTCEYVKVDGKISNELLLEVSGMQEYGPVFYEGGNQCGQVRDVTDFYDLTGEYAFAQVRCE